MAKPKAFECRGAWGVERDGAVIYEASFVEATARRIAELEGRPRPPRDWYATERLLKRDGFDTRVVEPREEVARG